MRQVILLITSLSVCAAASDTIKSLFESRSIPEYDRWLWHNRSDYPGLRPIRAQVGVEQSPSGWGRLYAVSYTDSGTVCNRHVYPDSWNLRSVVQMSPITIKEDGDRFAVRRWMGPAARITAYDRMGRKLFDSALGVVPGFGLWFRAVRGAESTQVLNDSGSVIGVLPSLSIGNMGSSGDTLFVAPSRAGTIVFDRKARVRWQDGVSRAGPYVATISSGGREVAVAARDSVVLRDMVSGMTTVRAVDSAVGRQRLDLIAWSSDCRRIAMYRRDNEVPDSATLWTVACDGTLVGPAQRLAASYTERMFWMGDTVVLVASPHVPDMRKRMHDKPLQRGSCKVTAVVPSGKIQEWTVTGLFGRLGGWFQQGRNLAYVDTQLSYFAAFQVPMQ
jgi:hypothetical protein